MREHLAKVAPIDQRLKRVEVVVDNVNDQMAQHNKGKPKAPKVPGGPRIDGRVLVSGLSQYYVPFITIQVFSPHGEQIWQQAHIYSESHFNVGAPGPGTYKVCFVNPWESRTEAIVDLVYITLAHLRSRGGPVLVPKGTQASRDTEVAGVAHMEDVQRTILGLTEFMQASDFRQPEIPSTQAGSPSGYHGEQQTADVVVHGARGGGAAVCVRHPNLRHNPLLQDGQNQAQCVTQLAKIQGEGQAGLAGTAHGRLAAVSLAPTGGGYLSGVGRAITAVFEAVFTAVFRWLRPVYSEAKRSQVRGLMSSTSYNIRFYDRDVSAALNIRRCAVGPGPRPTELCYWDGRPAMPKPGRPGQEWVYLRDKALLPEVQVQPVVVNQADGSTASAPAPQPVSGVVKGDVSGPMLEPSAANKGWVRATATLAAVTAAAGSSALLPGRLAAFMHVAAFGLWLGSNIWNTFFVGLTMFKHMPRQTFGRVQSALFPQYFTLTTGCNILLLGSLLLCGAPGPATTSAALALGGALACSMANMLWVEPVATRLMFQRYDIENKPNKSEEDKAQIAVLYKSFGKYHGISSLLNLVITCVAFSHAWFLGGLIKL
ncbi:hypothetical protein QJQ45_023311 [Haematococcus lacustris]|nr:hypothetical protein QJQ45_023311 [Haematococcus lacustris]